MQTIQKTIKTLAIIIGFIAFLPAFGMNVYINQSSHNSNNTTQIKSSSNNWSFKKCDGCGQSSFNTNTLERTTNSIQCSHVLCKECKNIKTPAHYYSCPYCPWLHNQTIEHNGDHHDLQNNRQRAQGHPLQGNNNKPAHIPVTQNPNNPAQYEPAHENPGNLPTPGNFTIDNKIKWFGAAGIAIIACYGVYTWWKGEDASEKDTDDEQENENKEEAQPAEQV